MTTTSAKRSASQSGAMGAPSGPRASLPSASRRSGVGTAKRSVYKSRGDGAGFGGLGVSRRMNAGGRIQGQPKRSISKSGGEKG